MTNQPLTIILGALGMLGVICLIVTTWVYDWWGNLLIVVGTSLGIAALVLLIAATLRKLDPVWAAGGRIELTDDNVLTLLDKKLFRTETPRSTISLDAVTDVTWSTITFVPKAPMSLQFWSEDPQLSLHVFGFMPNDSQLQPLIEFSLRKLEVTAPMKAKLQDYLNRRVSAGTLRCNFDVQTLEPLPEALPPLADGVSFEGTRMVQRWPSSK